MAIGVVIAVGLGVMVSVSSSGKKEAMATVRDFEGAPGTVVDEAGRGYLWEDELLRPARVRVAE